MKASTPSPLAEEGWGEGDVEKETIFPFKHLRKGERSCH